MFADFAERRCSENGYWLDEQGQESDQGWTNFYFCFRKEITDTHDSIYNGTGRKMTQTYWIISFKVNLDVLQRSSKEIKTISSP